MEAGLKQQRYVDVAEVARLAAGVARLLQKQDSTTSRPPAPPLKRTRKRQVSGRQAARGGKRETTYPRFERDGDKLVKVGWSKKNREAYEHRAPREAVIAFVRHLSSRVAAGEVFAMENVLPAPDVVGGGELPAYQAYLTLAWLRQVGVVDKKGRDGYVLRIEPLTNGELDRLWGELPTRST